MKTLKQVGSIAAGALMLGAAVSGAVSAGLDATGMTRGFFYDAGYNPIVQIVVGEKGMATDAVAAGNIAAVIGNLAYTSTAVAPGAPASGQVVLGISARGATGKYEQQDGLSNPIKIGTSTQAAFYDENEGLGMNTSSMSNTTYKRGSFISYSLACNQQERTEAGILKRGVYNNVHCLFCETLCLAALENPEHIMEEEIFVDFTKMRYYEAGLRSDDAEFLGMTIDANAVKYTLDAGWIPMNKLTTGGSNADDVDFEWRGQFILFGEEYFVKDISGQSKVYLAKGRILDDISSEGYTSEYMGYKFKIDHLIYSAEYMVAGILLDVEKPDGTVVQTQISKMANGIVDDIEIAGVYAAESDAVATASIMVYDTTTNVLLENNKDLELGGEVQRFWRVRLTSKDMSVGAEKADVDIADYDVVTVGRVLESVDVEYRRAIDLREGEALEFPSTYKIIFSGYRTKDYVESPCSGAGEGDIQISKEGRYRATISFTGDDGQRYDGVYIDQGPMVEGDMFVMNGLVYEYTDSERVRTSDTELKVTLRDMLNGGRNDYTLDAQTTDVVLTTYAFEEASRNQRTINIRANADPEQSEVFFGAFDANRNLLYDNGDLYLTPDSYATLVSGPNYVGIDETVFGSALTKFELRDAKLAVSVRDEKGTDLNADTPATSNTDDRLIVVKATGSYDEYLVVDFYDRDFDQDDDNYYRQGVWASGNELGSSAWTSTVATGYSGVWNDEKDTLVILPDTNLRATVNYGGARQVNAVSICMPQDIVSPTVFIGTAEEATTLDTTITKADEGTEKTAGCCTYLVKEFGISAGAAGAATVRVNPIVGNLVVPEIAADTTKNLIIVGGPAVNGMAALSREEIQAASGQYVVRKDGNKLYVAGWTAADTIDGGNALIAWLQNNVH
jgi:hypothetical protein